MLDQTTAFRVHVWRMCWTRFLCHCSAIPIGSLYLLRCIFRSMVGRAKPRDSRRSEKASGFWPV
nr:alpha-mannosidase isoform X3 [Ipomoea batatas]